MKVSELLLNLDKVKETKGDIEVVFYGGDSLEDHELIGFVCESQPHMTNEICKLVDNAGGDVVFPCDPL